MDEALPPGWQRAVDAQGRTYYQNDITRETQWERPRWSDHQREWSVPVAQQAVLVEDGPRYTRGCVGVGLCCALPRGCVTPPVCSMLLAACCARVCRVSMTCALPAPQLQHLRAVRDGQDAPHHLHLLLIAQRVHHL